MRAVLAALAAAWLASGCQALLPDASEAVRIEWHTFEEASAAIEKIVPFETHKSELSKDNIDPMKNPGVTLLSYPEVVQRFASGSALRPEELDPGIRLCLLSSKTCTGYAIVARRLWSERTANFWLDSLNFRREVDTRGWTFNAIVLFVDDVAVYRSYGGQPNVRERKVQRNPLGPLQGWGDAVPGLLW